MSRLIWSKASQRDIANIDVFITRENPAAAARIARAVRHTVLRLLDFPRRGRPYEDGFRVLGARTTPYLVIYRVRDGLIEIARIRYTSENWQVSPEDED